MARSSRSWKTTAFVATLAMCSSGCITVTLPQSLSLKSLTGQNNSQIKYEEGVAEAPPEPKNPLRVKLGYALLMEDSGQLPEARGQYQSVLEDDPKNVDAIIGLARVEAASGDAEKAEKLYREGLKLRPQSAPARFFFGQFLSQQQRWNEAAEQYHAATLAQPHETRYRHALAVSLARQGDIDTALSHFIRTVGNAEAHYNVALILHEQGLVDDAAEQLRIAVAKKPSLTAAQDWLAYLEEDPAQPQTPGSQPTPTGTVVPAGHSTMYRTPPPAPRAPGNNPTAPPRDGSLTTNQLPPPRPLNQARMTPKEFQELRSQHSTVLR